MVKGLNNKIRLVSRDYRETKFYKRTKSTKNYRKFLKKFRNKLIRKEEKIWIKEVE